MGRLTAKSIATLKTPGRHSDGDGLYLNIAKAGTKSWTFIWKAGGKKHEMGLGSITVFGLADARQKAMEARRMVKSGENPILARKHPTGETFGAVADRYLKERVAELKNAAHRRRSERILIELAAPIRDKPVADISVDDVLLVLEPVWRSRRATGVKMRILLRQVLAFAKALGMRTGANPAAWQDNLADILPAPRAIYVGHRAALPFAEVPHLMRQLTGSKRRFAPVMMFAILTGTRSAEARLATWDEIDFDARLWTIPASRRKQKMAKATPSDALEIPLSRAALAILADARRRHDGKSELVFPGQKPGRPLADNNAGKTLAKLGTPKERATLHGFRSSFRDWCGDATEFPRELAEAALGHKVGNATEQAYRRNSALERRREVMEAWAKFAIFGDSEKKVSRAAGKRPEAVTANPKKVARIER